MGEATMVMEMQEAAMEMEMKETIMVMLMREVIMVMQTLEMITEMETLAIITEMETVETQFPEPKATQTTNQIFVEHLGLLACVLAVMLADGAAAGHELRAQSVKKTIWSQLLILSPNYKCLVPNLIKFNHM